MKIIDCIVVMYEGVHCSKLLGAYWLHGLWFPTSLSDQNLQHTTNHYRLSSDESRQSSTALHWHCNAVHFTVINLNLLCLIHENSNEYLVLLFCISSKRRMIVITYIITFYIIVLSLSAPSEQQHQPGSI